jgi:hypothetical protein
VRAGPLSDENVVNILNQYFIPVYLTIEAYEPGGSAGIAEQAEFKRICGEISEAKKGIAFIVHPKNENAHVIETMISSPAVTVERVTDVLERARRFIGTQPGPALGKKIPQAPPPTVDDGGLVLHLSARYLPANGKGWARMPVEDWIVLHPEDCVKFMGAAVGKVGEEWKIDSGIAEKLLGYFYPPSLNFYHANGKLKKKDMSAKVVSVKDGIALIRIDGCMNMKRSFTFAKDDDEHVEADIVGYAKYDINKKRLQSIEIITDSGKYSRASFGIGVRSLPQ